MLYCIDCGRPAADLLDGYCAACHLQILEAMAEVEEWMQAERDEEIRVECEDLVRALLPFFKT